MSAWKGFGQQDSPEVYSPEGVISLPSGPIGLRMSIVAQSDAIAIHTLFMPRKRPGQMLRRALVFSTPRTTRTMQMNVALTDAQSRRTRGGTSRVRHGGRAGTARA